MLGLCLPLLIHTITHHSHYHTPFTLSHTIHTISHHSHYHTPFTLSHTIRLQMIYNHRYLLLMKYPSYFTLYSYAYLISWLWRHPTCLNLMTTRQNSCMSAKKELAIFHKLPTLVSIVNAIVPFKLSVKNLCFTLDCYLTMNHHISTISEICCFTLCCLTSIHKFLTNR